MKFSALYESLYADARDGRVRTSLISLSSLSMYVDLRALFQFAQTLSGRVDSADGELRVRGVPDQADGWHPFSLS